jgi:hypothetical protein
MIETGAEFPIGPNTMRWLSLDHANRWWLPPKPRISSSKSANLTSILLAALIHLGHQVWTLRRSSAMLDLIDQVMTGTRVREEGEGGELCLSSY